MILNTCLVRCDKQFHITLTSIFLVNSLLVIKVNIVFLVEISYTKPILFPLPLPNM